MILIGKRHVTRVSAHKKKPRKPTNRHYGQTETESMDSMLVEFTDTAIDFTQTESASQMAAADDSDAPVVKLCNLVIQAAVNHRASDIHVDPFGDRVRVRDRIYGDMVSLDS